MTAILHATGLVRRFGGVRALRGVDLSVVAGEVVGIIGPNGAGKTTLFNVLSGSERADAGRIVFADADVTGWLPEQAAACGVARTFQHGRVFANLSVLDNVLVGAHARLRAVRPLATVPVLGGALEVMLALARPAAVRAEEATLRADAHALLALFGERLLPRADAPAHSLSYANRRRLEIARALAMRPRLLLLDEPTAGMNETETMEMQTMLAGLKALDQTMLLIEHKLELVMRLCDRVVVMDDGAVIAQGPPEQVRCDPAVIAAYLGGGGALVA